MKMLIALAALLPLAALAADPVNINGTTYPNAQDTKPTADNTAGVVLFEVDHAPQFILFVSKTGNIAGEKFEDCFRNTICRKLATQFSIAKRLSILDVETAKKDTAI